MDTSNATQLKILASAALKPGLEKDWNREIPQRLKRRDPRIWHMAYVAVNRLMHKHPCTPGSIITSTALGALDETKEFLNSIFKTGFSSPRHFISSVHNSVAGKLAIEFSITGPNLTFCDGPNSFASALTACNLLSENNFPILLVSVDESIEFLKTLGPHLLPECEKFLSTDWKEAAVAFILDKKSKEPKPTIYSTGSRPIACDITQGKFAKLANETQSKGINLIQSINPGLEILNLISEGKSGNYIIASHSPSAQSIAAIELCI